MAFPSEGDQCPVVERTKAADPLRAGGKFVWEETPKTGLLTAIHCGHRAGDGGRDLECGPYLIK